LGTEGEASAPLRVHIEHYLHAVTVLLGEPEWVLPQHQFPRDRAMASVVGATLANVGQPLQGLVPTPPRHFRIAIGTTISVTEMVAVSDLAGRDIPGPGWPSCAFQPSPAARRTAPVPADPKSPVQWICSLWVQTGTRKRGSTIATGAKMAKNIAPITMG